MRYVISFLLCGVFLATSVAAQKITYQQVSAFGLAETQEEAINAALTRAITKVNGAAIDAKNLIAKVTKSSSQDGVRSTQTDKAMQRNYREASRGVVSSYEIVKLEQQSDGQWRADVTAKIAQLSLSGQAGRKRIAILPFRVDASQKALNRLADDPGLISSKFSQALEDKITSSRRFTVLDREFMNQTLGEKALVLDNPLLPIEETLKLSQNIIAEMIVVGSVSAVSYKLVPVHFKTLDRTIQIPQGEVALSYKIIDVTTNQTKFSGKVMRRYGSDDFLKIFDAGNVPDPVMALAELASVEMADEILAAIYPLMIAAVNGGSVTLNQGGDLITVGDVYKVYRRDNKIIDPYTKEALGYEETEIAEIRVDNVNAKFSTAKIVSGADLAQDFAPKRLVCRLVTKGKSQAQQRAAKADKEMDDFFADEPADKDAEDPFGGDDWQ
jgi:hypothetical protein